jgi:DNA-binding MarR family transcriptional regulator
MHIMSTEPNFAKCADCLCLASRRAARRITRAFDRELRPYGLRATQFTILLMLSLRGAMTIGELAEALGSERTTLTRNLALIENAGWIKTEPAEDDARSRIVSVTDAARETVAQAFRGWRKAQAATGRRDRLGWHRCIAAAGPRGTAVGTNQRRPAATQSVYRR